MSDVPFSPSLIGLFHRSVKLYDLTHLILAIGKQVLPKNKPENFQDPEIESRPFTGLVGPRKQKRIIFNVIYGRKLNENGEWEDVLLPAQPIQPTQAPARDNFDPFTMG